MRVLTIVRTVRPVIGRGRPVRIVVQFTVFTLDLEVSRCVVGAVVRPREGDTAGPRSIGWVYFAGRARIYKSLARTVHSASNRRTQMGDILSFLR